MFKSDFYNTGSLSQDDMSNFIVLERMGAKNSFIKLLFFIRHIFYIIDYCLIVDKILSLDN